MTTTSLTPFETNGRRLPDSTVQAEVRKAFLNADNKNQKRPGRPALVELTGGTEHQVRRAMRIAESEIPKPESDVPRNSPNDHQDGTSLETEILHPPDKTPPQPDEPLPARQADAPPSVPDVSNPRGSDPPRAWPLGLIGLAAAVAVWGGWVDLGQFTGFGMVQPLPGLVDGLWINTAIVLPVGIEAYGGYALRTWLSSAALSARTRTYAGWSALASLVVGGGAQVASHLLKANDISVAPWWVTVVVSCVPVAVLGLATGLATLVRQDTTVTSGTSSD